MFDYIKKVGGSGDDKSSGSFSDGAEDELISDKYSFGVSSIGNSGTRHSIIGMASARVLMPSLSIRLTTGGQGPRCELFPATYTGQPGS